MGLTPMYTTFQCFLANGKSSVLGLASTRCAVDMIYDPTVGCTVVDSRSYIVDSRWDHGIQVDSAESDGSKSVQVKQCMDLELEHCHTWSPLTTV
jgi:hypothetical protein